LAVFFLAANLFVREGSNSAKVSRKKRRMDEGERQLILKAQQGDQWAFARLVSRYDRQILALARDMVGDLEDAQDVFQEVFLAAYRGLPKFRMESDLSTWLYRIAVNKALKFRRQRQRQAELEAAGVREETGSGGADPAQGVLEAEFRAQFNRALDQLSRRERMAFVLCHRQGLKIAQAATLMSCSAGSVKSYLFRAREKVRAVLQQYLET